MLVDREPSRRSSTAAASDDTPRLTVSTVLHKPHAIIRQLDPRLKEHGYLHQGMLVVRGVNGATVRVGPPSKARALRLLDALCKALEARGHAVSLTGNQYRHYLSADVGGEAVKFSLTENAKQRPHVLTAKELEDQRRWGHSYSPKHDYAPSGQLTLHVDTFYRSALRGSWSDGVRRRLEDLLGEVVVAIEAQGEALRLRQIEQRQAAELAAERRRQEAVEQRAREYQEALGSDLLTMAAHWNEAEQVRAFVAAVERRVRDDGLLDAAADWLDWARAFARSRDPLTHPEKIAKRLTRDDRRG
ncbi:MAG TPA: hypothetical protein VF331_00245 [Polyangiales bacterium]